MNKIIFDIQRFTEDNSGDTASDALELMHSIIQRFDLKTVDDTKLQGGSSTLNSTLKFIGTFWGSLFFKKSTRTTEVNALTTMLAGTVSIVEDIYAIREEKNKNNPSEVLITAKAEDLISNLTSLTNSFQKLASGKNSFILSIVSSVVGLAANLVLSMDGLKEDEIEKINKSYVSLLQVSSAEIIKKFFSAGLADNLIKMPVSQILDNPAVKAEIRKQTATNFTKGSGPLGLIFAAITGILNAANEYDSRVKKYTEDGIPEDITKHDARIDAIATFVHDTASYYAKGFDDTVFKWIQAGLSFIRGEDIPYYTDKNYVEVITDWFKTLNYENSGTSGDDKFYVLENKSMVYGDSGNDNIGNYGFSNVTIWGGHDDDTLGSYKTDSATPQNNSIFGGPGDDQISVYDKDSTIYGGNGKDFINVVGTNNEIFSDADDDKFYIANGANNNTLSGDNGDDFIVMLEDAKNTMIKYASGDGNDTIYGFNEDDSLKISDSYKTTVDGNHLKITVGEGSILLVDMAGKNININGKTIKSGEENSTIEPVPPPEFPTLPATVASPIIYGTESDDTIKNSKDYMVIQALGGNDSVANWYGDHTTINTGMGDDSVFNDSYCSLTAIETGSGNDSVYNRSSNVTISTGDGNDTVKNVESDFNTSYGPSSEDSVSINTGEGNDSVLNDGWYCTIETGSGNDSVYNHGSNVVIKTRDGDDVVRNIKENYGSSMQYLYDGSDSVSIHTDAGNDSVANYGNFVIINTGVGNDSVANWYGDHTTINTGTGDDSVFNGWVIYSTINPGEGNDLISLASYSGYNLIQYTSGDGDDTIYGFTGNDTLNISGAKHSTTKSGDDIIVTVDEGKITLVGATSLSAFYIEGIKDSSSDSKLITLTEGNDNYSNTIEGETINALGGDDTILNDGGASVSVNGGEGNDSIYSLLKGTVHPDSCTLIGGDGNDTIWNDGEEVPYGGVEILIDCGNGDDNVSNDGENSTVLGGAGNEEINNWSAKSSIDGGDGNDIIYNQNDSTNKTASNVTITGGVGDDSIYNGNWSLGGSSVSIDGGDGNDLIHNGNWNSGVSLNGGDSVTILGGAGDDSIFNYKGIKSFIDCGTGNDSVYIDNDYLTVTSGDGNDTIDGNCAYSSVNGDTGNDKITILNWNNATVNGGKGNDTLYGSNSNNATINGSGILYQYSNGDGNDIIYGFSENSTLSISGGSYSTTKSDDNIIVTVGEEKISLIGAAILNEINIDGEEEDSTNLTFNNKTGLNVTLPAQTETVDASERTKPIRITGNTLANSLFGGKGNDTLDGTEGNNTLTGGKGNDIFVYNGGNDIITDYEKGKDKISLDSASISNFTITNKDVIFALSNNNSLTLNNMADKQISFLSDSKTNKMAFTNNASLDSSGKGATLISATTEFSAANYSKLVTINAESASSAVNITGNNKANRIIAGNHGSTLNGGKGKDSLIGGNGSDIFTYENKSGNKVIQNYSSSDTISLVSAQISDASIKSNDVILKVGSKKITVKGATSQKITISEDGTTKSFVDNILYDEDKTFAILSSKFSAKTEKVFESTVSYIDASNAKKKLILTSGYSGFSTILGGKKNDSLTANSGNDILYGGKGNDSLYGSYGNDTLWGEAGKDKLYGGEGNDTLQGGKGNDSLWGGNDTDTFLYSKGDGKDIIYGFDDNDILQITDNFSTAYNSSKGEIYFKVGSTKNAITLKDFTATNFNINSNSYQISGSSLIKK